MDNEVNCVLYSIHKAWQSHGFTAWRLTFLTRKWLWNIHSGKGLMRDWWRQCGGTLRLPVIQNVGPSPTWNWRNLGLSISLTGSLGHWVVVESPISHWSSVAASDWGASVETTNPPWALELKVSPRRLKQRCLVQIPHCYRGRLAPLPGN